MIVLAVVLAAEWIGWPAGPRLLVHLRVCMHVVLVRADIGVYWVLMRCARRASLLRVVSFVSRVHVVCVCMFGIVDLFGVVLCCCGWCYVCVLFVCVCMCLFVCAGVCVCVCVWFCCRAVGLMVRIRPFQG